MKKYILCIILSVSIISIASAQSAKKLYKLYNTREFVKCLVKCDATIEKYPNFYEPYYIKAITYFEMAQLPEKYKDVTKDPLMDCIKTLSILRAKDPDGTIFEEHSDTLQMIYNYADAVAKSLREKNKDKAILMYQRLMRAYNLHSNALNLLQFMLKWAITNDACRKYRVCTKNINPKFRRRTKITMHSPKVRYCLPKIGCSAICFG